MDQQPKIPTLKDAQKPQVKIKGLSAGMTLFDRLKQFKKKDLAFILAGLGTLFMAPLAEHFMMAPEGGDGQLEKGWGGGKGGSGSNLFGGGSSPYETNGGIAQGGAIGGGGDIITPLNVRDPSALVMGPGQAQQPNAGSIAPATPPPSAPVKSETDYKDALAGAASRAASAAVKKSPLPVPKVALGGSGLRGLGVAGGGTSASGSLGPIGPAAGSVGGGGGGSMNLVKTAPGYRGAAGARGPGNPTGLDGTKRAGQNAGDAFSRTGSALDAAKAAASEQIPTGGSGFGGSGQGGAGANDKGPGGSGPGGSKSVGESLAFLEAKQRMENRLKNEFEMDKLKDNERLLYEIRNDAAKEIAKGLAGAFTKSITSTLFPGAGADGSTEGFLCKSDNDINKFYPKSIYFVKDGNLCKGDPEKQCDPVGPTGCSPFTKPGKAEGTPPPTVEEGAVSTVPGVNGPQAAAMANLGTVCTDLDTLIEKGEANDKVIATKIRAEAAGYVSVRDALYKGPSQDCLGAGRNATLDAFTESVAAQQRAAIGVLKPLIVTLTRGAKGTTGVTATAADAKTAVDKARTSLQTVKTEAEPMFVAATADRGWSDVTRGKVGPNEEAKRAMAATNTPILERIDKVMDGSRPGLQAALKSALEAQGTLDGKNDAGEDVPAEKSKDKKVVPALTEITAGPSAEAGNVPIKITVTTNAAYPKIATELAADITKSGAKPEGGTAGPFASDASGIAFGVGGSAPADKGYAQLDAAARTAIQTAAVDKTDWDTKKAAAEPAEPADTKQARVNEATAAKNKAVGEDGSSGSLKAANEAWGAAQKTQVGVQTAQTTWLDNVNAMVSDAESKVPAK